MLGKKFLLKLIDNLEGLNNFIIIFYIINKNVI